MGHNLLQRGVAVALLGLPLVAGPAQAKLERTVDLLIVGGTVYAGDLTPPSVTDIGIVGDKIVFVGSASKAGVRGKKTLSAQGMMVTPGFIDTHTHTDDELTSPDAAKRLVARQVYQGVTTSFIGVDGFGGPDIMSSLDKMQQAGVGQNVAAYVGFGGIRESVLHDEARAPTPAELETMKGLAAKAMCQGALGLSSGLFYAPQSFAKTDEVIAVAKEAGKRGGGYDTHQRDEGTSSIGVDASLAEAIRIGEESGAPLHVAHIKVTNGPHDDGRDMAEVIRIIEAARAKGQNITADQYPWSAANTGLDAVAMPRWAQEGGRDALVKRLNDPAEVAKIRADNGLAPGLAPKIVISEAPNHPELIGKSLADLGAQWGVEPIDAAIRVLKGGEAGVVVYVITEPDIKKVMTQPWVMTSSDGGDGGHPRGYASYTRLWERYVQEGKVITPVQFVHRSTGLPADTFSLTGRGYIKAGYFADVAVIDPQAYHAKATYEAPDRLSTGVVDVIVNGQIELEAGKPTGVLSGRAVRKIPTPGTCP